MIPATQAAFLEEQPVTYRKKPISNPTSASDDIECLKAVARLLLRHLEAAIKRRKTSKDALAPQAEKQAMMFGKRGYVDTLVTLTDLLLKLDQAKSGGALVESSAPQDIPMSDADVALVDAFVERMRHQKMDSD